MIRNDAIANQTADLMNRAHALLMDSLKLVRENCSEDEYREFQAGMAHILGRLFFLLMEPIYREHPSLAPPDTPKEFFETWHKEPGGNRYVSCGATSAASQSGGTDQRAGQFPLF